MLKTEEQKLNYFDFSINIIIINSGGLSILQYFTLSPENRLWLSYIDVGALTSSFMILSYWLGRNFQNSFREFLIEKEKVQINFRNLWMLSTLAGFLNSMVASFMYYQMPGIKYKVYTTGMMILFMVVSFGMSIFEMIGLIGVKQTELRDEFEHDMLEPLKDEK
ncbi:MAG: hypothetical protein AAB657_00600 [Patescibacteria group bacterium]